ncbi:hypothetical protein [Streptomyces marincola]|uniref:hypothetical protein n=1 Tax=Streptomyces marincola TaxID=2878388 RepID=UPI001CF4E91A|nr:hypothetical protein [Streptomyces marincola]UCM88010.1 hypothetical protein LC193_08600 [Streptomyces marincola]
MDLALDGGAVCLNGCMAFTGEEVAALATITTAYAALHEVALLLRQHPALPEHGRVMAAELAESTRRGMTGP